DGWKRGISAGATTAPSGHTDGSEAEKSGGVRRLGDGGGGAHDDGGSGGIFVVGRIDGEASSDRTTGDGQSAPAVKSAGAAGELESKMAGITYLPALAGGVTSDAAIVGHGNRGLRR